MYEYGRGGKCVKFEIKRPLRPDSPPAQEIGAYLGFPGERASLGTRRAWGTRESERDCCLGGVKTWPPCKPGKNRVRSQAQSGSG